MKEQTLFPSTAPKPYHHGSLRQSLVDATLDMLRSTPADKITVAKVARSVGVSSGAPFRHFKDRGALMAHAAAAGFVALKEHMGQGFDTHPEGSIDRIVAGGYAYVLFGVENPHLFRLMWTERRQEIHSAITREAGRASYQHFIVNLACTMSANGFAEDDPETFGAPLWTMVHGYAELLIEQNRMLGDNLSEIEQQICRATHAYFIGMRASCSFDETKG